jgi:hypothetical protein
MEVVDAAINALATAHPVTTQVVKKLMDGDCRSFGSRGESDQLFRATNVKAIINPPRNQWY